MKRYIVTHCRELIFLVFSVYSELFPPFLGITLLSFLPAFLYGCNAPPALPHHDAETVTRISMEASSGQIREMDIFVFRDDRMQKLDCYQKVEDPISWNNEIVSGSGGRLIAACINSGKTVMDWTSVSSLSSLRNLSVSLEDESMQHPFMSGMLGIYAGKDDRERRISLSPIFSIVELRSIRCDFSRRPYAGEVLKDVKVYLTNVNAECRILEHSEILPSRIINAGKLREEDIDMFPDQELIVRDIEGDIGKKVRHPGIQLICYPNNSQNEGPGTPFTRLVIEGKIEGDTFYWPLNINKDDGGYGIGRNEKYVFDVSITRKGSPSPDIPVSKEDIDIIFSIERWNEKEDCEIIF